MLLHSIDPPVSPGKEVPGNGNALPPCPSGTQQSTPPPPPACPEGAHGAAGAPSAGMPALKFGGLRVETLLGGEEKGSNPSPAQGAIPAR